MSELIAFPAIDNDLQACSAGLRSSEVLRTLLHARPAEFTGIIDCTSPLLARHSPIAPSLALR